MNAKWPEMESNQNEGRKEGVGNGKKGEIK